MNQDMLDKVRTSTGFLAALGRAAARPQGAARLRRRRVQYDGDDAMFDMVHAMEPHHHQPRLRRRPVLGAILFE